MPAKRKVPAWDITRLPCGCPDSAQRFLLDGQPTRPRVIWDDAGIPDVVVFDAEGKAHDPLAVIARLGLHCKRHGDVREMVA